MTNEDIKDKVKKHVKWLRGEADGARAIFASSDLKSANLGCKNLNSADFRCADLGYARLSGSLLKSANFEFSNLRHADFSGANLSLANLTYTDLKWADFNHTELFDADLKGADIDFSCLPLRCGALYVHFDDRQLRQIAYHLVKAGMYSKNASVETKKELNKLVDFANGFHRAKECGLIEKMGEE